MAKKKVSLDIGREIKLLNGPMPQVLGEDGVRNMQIKDVLLQRIPIAASRDNDSAVRLWDIGIRVNEGKDTIELSALDFELLKNSVLAGEVQTWARVNLNNAFNDAKETKEK